VGVIGNSVNRLLRFTLANFEGKTPDAAPWGELEEKYLAQFQTHLDTYNAELEAIRMRKSSEALRALWVSVNEYLTEGAPWTALKTDRALAAMRVNFAFSLLMMLAALSRPIIPFTADKMAASYGLSPAEASGWYTNARDGAAHFAASRTLSDPGLLFSRLEDDRVAELKERFGSEKA
jgi:methionyl-tRNA synthetase